jgi:cytochrome c oxidase assembly protein subunit 15
MLALVLFAFLTAYAQQTWEEARSSVRTVRIRPLPALFIVVSLLILFVQVFLGAWVSTNYAVLACPDFPTCLGSAWPETNWAEGFSLWRELGLNAQGEFISPVALQTIHWAHRVFAVLVLFCLGFLGVKAYGLSTPATPILKRFSILLIALLLLQVITGISNVIFQWPLLAALLHTAGSAALVFCLVRMSQWASWKSPIQMKMAKSL